MKRRNVSVIVYGTRNHSATDLTTSRDAVAEDQASYLRLHWDPPGMRVPHGPTKKKAQNPLGSSMKIALLGQIHHSSSLSESI